MVTQTLNWYVVYTYPKKEQKIYTDLVRQKVTTYLPLHKVVRRWSDRLKELMVPLFPNYIFVQIRDNERVGVLRVPGVARFVAFEGRPTVISDEEIDMIRRLENTPVELESHLINGDRVQIMQGPFAGLKGVLFKKQGKERFGLRLDGLRQALSLDICVSFLKKI